MANNRGSLVDAMSELLTRGTGADVTLCVRGGEVEAHSLILAARSPVFAAMLLQHDTEEAASGRVQIPDVEAATMRQLVRYVYTDEVPEGKESAAELLVAADKYGLLLLKEDCEDRLLQNLCLENVAECAVLAWQHCCSRLLGAAVEVISRDPPEARKTEGWREGVACCPRLMTEISDLVEAKISAAKEEALKKWLHEAAECGNMAEIVEILAQGVDINCRCEHGNTALHKAAKGGDVLAVNWLLEAGADVCAQNNWQQTPLHVAAGYGRQGVAMALLFYRADKDAWDGSGQTALQVAAACGEASVVNLLLRLGADRSAAGYGMTPLQLAQAYNRKAVVDILSGIRTV
ncbi:ankyrin-1-like isoform X2 [Schistocerca cancellata]|uniref:ankyrin-1-like isoform X2 n=1 Tax=Schistocerca cancellata TaxID=274614 RepID=UPI0021189B60|nr:ankyrin-1-like isoform X2 [Schistocerca cancellata]